MNVSRLSWRPLSFYTFCNDWFLWGGQRTFSPFYRRIVTTYTLEVGAAGDGDNRDHPFSALRAARYLIHDVLPIFHPNQEDELLFHWRPSGEPVDTGRYELIKGLFLKPLLRPVARTRHHAGYRQGVTRFALRGGLSLKWWAATDSNRRPSRCKRDALTS